MESRTEYRDGDFSEPAAISPAIPSYPFEAVGDTQTRMISQRFQVEASGYRRPSNGTAYPYRSQVSRNRSLKLIAHSVPTYVDADLIEYDAVWAELPRNRTESEPYSHTYQYTRVVDDETQLGEVTKTVAAIFEISYIETSNPAEITIRSALRYVRFPGGILPQGGTSAGQNWTQSNGYILARDTSFARWVGDFWAVTEIWVPNIPLGEVLGA
jgi:hypothetical protein